MSQTDERIITVRRRILDLKDQVTWHGLDVSQIDEDAGRSMTRARAALFEAWTILVGPPEEEDEDH